jgi:hypothetical protein
MVDTVQIEFDELIFHGRYSLSSNGLSFNTLDGWGDLTDSKASIEERAQGHGAFGLGDVYRAARVMQLKGHVLAEDVRQAERRRAELAAVFARDRLRMRVTTAFSSSWRWVTIARAKLPMPSTGEFPYSLDIVAVDPFRYEDGDQVSTGLPTPGTGHTWPMVWPIDWGTPGNPGRLTLTNPGTAVAWPIFQIQGGIQDGFELEEVGTGRIIRFDQTVLVGSTVEINPRVGTVFVDGVSRSTFLTRRDWFSIPPGGTTQVQFRALGDPFGDPLLVGLVSPTYV